MTDDLKTDIENEQKEQQRIEDNYWGKGSEPIEKIEENNNERGNPNK